MASSIVKGALDRNMALSEVGEFRSQTGEGVRGLVNGKMVSLGNRIFLERDLDIQSRELSDLNKRADH